MILKRLADALRGLFRANVAPGGPAALAARLEEKVLRLVDNMPTMPDTAARAMALLDDPGLKFADLARLIERDAAIATGLLRVSNSVLYASSTPALKIDQAVVRLGAYKCKNLILAVGLRSMLREAGGGVRDQSRALWHHGYVTASLCVQLNRAYRLGFCGEEYSAGLLHDLGRILLALADPECLALAGAMDFREDGDVRGRERAAIGIDHSALGGWFGEHSNLPAPLVQVMREHHDPAAGGEYRRLVALVGTADHMANHVQRGDDPRAYDPAANAGLACLAERWTAAKRDHLLGQLPALMEEAAQAAALEQLAH